MPVTLDVISERLTNHMDNDEVALGRLLGEVSNVTKTVGELSTKLTVLNVTLAPVIEHYMTEHPSKIQAVPLSGPAPKRKAVLTQEMKVLGALLTLITLATQALQMLLHK